MCRFFWLLAFAPSFLWAERPNLLLITIDTLRADRLGCYGYTKARTPHLDALARESMFFESAFCPTPLTLPSHTSLMTGRYPHRHGVRDNAGSVPASETTLAETLRQNGYHTYAFVGGFPLDHRFGLNQGFDVYDDTFPREKNRSLDFRSERSADLVLEAALRTRITEPFFLWLHFYDPHAPYLRGGYDGEVAFVDEQVGRVVQKWKNDRTWIAVAGDHGESLGEHGEWTHRIFVYDSVMRVPFWINGPGIAPQRVQKQVRLVDFLPTIFARMGIAPPSGLDGLVLPDRAGAAAILESYFPLFQLGWSPPVAIRTDRWKYIEVPRPELYDLRADATEAKNVYEANREIAKRLQAYIPEAATVVSPSQVSPEMAEQLAALGYVSGSTEARSSSIDPKDRIAVWNEIERAVDLENTRPEETLQILENARRLDPNNPMILGFLAQKYAEGKRYEEAGQILQSVLKRDPRNALALYRMARVALEMGQAREAKRWAEMLYEQESRNADALIVLAQVNLKLEDYSSAVSNLKGALEIDPRDTGLRVDLGNLYMQIQEYELGKMQFEEVLRMQDRNVQALNGLGTYWFVHQDWKASGRYLHMASQIDPMDVQTKMNLALLYSKEGKKQEALALYGEVANSPLAPQEWRDEAVKRQRELEP